jgi:protein-S-isoprenylcysteine O-methyltransferase Ste14
MSQNQAGQGPQPAGTASQTQPADAAAGTAVGVRRWLMRETGGVVFVALSLFIPAGRLDWVMGWALVAIYAAWVTAQALILIPKCPELLAERAERRKDLKRWDATLLGIIGLATLAKHIVAGLDYRFGWTPPIPLGVQLGAALLAVAALALVTWAMVANAFFSMTYRLQEDRGHAVATKGPYRYVRHPGYVGTVAFELATPFMLGSFWALVPAALVVVVTITRTALEDRSLHRELGGYAEYSSRVRFRLVPGVW